MRQPGESFEPRRDAALSAPRAERPAHLGRVQGGLFVLLEERDRVQVSAVVVTRDVTEEVLAAKPVRQNRPYCASEPSRTGDAHPIALRDARMRQGAVGSAEQLLPAPPPHAP